MKVKVTTSCFMLVLALSSLLIVSSNVLGANLGFRQICSDKTTEAGADEIYLLVTGKSSNGRQFFARLPRETDHWDMNDGNQGTKPASGYSGDAHCVANGTLVTDLRDGETWNIAVLVMEEDGGTSRDYQQLGSQVLQSINDPYAQGAGAVLGILTKLGVYAVDTDDYIGSFVINTTVSKSVQWGGGERLTHSIADPDAPTNNSRREYRMNGDGSNYVGWFYLR